MKLSALRRVLLAAAVAFAAPAAGQAPHAPAPKPHEDLIRLHAAGLSEEFLVRKVARDGVVYALTTDDIIACKKAGLPEPVIEAMLKTAPGPAAVAVVPMVPAPAPVPPAGPVPAAHAVPASAPAPAPTAAPTPSPEPSRAPQPAPAPGPAATPVPSPTLPSFPERSFGGLVRRGSEVVLFKDPWVPGTLSFRGGTLTWTDASDPTKSIVLEASDLVEQFLLCPRETDFDGACWEWGVKTDSSEHRFRDAAWAKATSAKPAEIHALVKAALPGLPDERYRASKKK